jgi:predicted permease
VRRLALMIESALQDLRFALRGWGRSPGFAIAAIATLALGIGANTAIFSLVSGVLLRPLPFAHPERLVEIAETQPRTQSQGGFEASVVYGDLEEWRKSGLFEGIVAYTKSGRNLQGMGEPEQVSIVPAEGGVFRLLGVGARMGRTFGEGDPLNVAVASHRFWKEHFGGNGAAIGSRITLDGQPYTVIGVMPEKFQFPYQRPSGDLYRAATTDLWIPWRAAEVGRNPNSRLEPVIGRLKEGNSPEPVREALNAMEGARKAQRVVRIESLNDAVSGAAREPLLVMLGAVGMVLLVACVNVANLLLARTASRSYEIGVRAALGASGFRLMRQFLTESLLLAAAGGTAGLGIGAWGSRILVRLAAAQIPRAEEIGWDWRIFAFLLAVCASAGLGFGLVPAMAAARSGTIALKRRSMGAMLRDGLVVVEVALAFVLLTGAGLLLETFLNLQRVNPGLNAENVQTLHVVVSGAQESMAIEERVAQISGVRAAGLISLLPLQNSGWYGFVRVTGRPEMFRTELRYVTPGYFRAMGIPLRRGREFSARDGTGTGRVILVNEALARQCFPNEDPVGRETDRGRIIGVVGDVRQEKLSIAATPEIYSAVAQNFAQMRNHGSTLVVRGSGPARALAGAIRAAVHEASPGQALFRVETMEQVMEESLASPRLYAWLLASFAGMGTLLAAAGVYGVIAYLVAARTREFGIRIALGAGSGRVVVGVMNRGGVLIGLGLALGCGGAVLLTKVLRGALYGVAATDAATFATVAAALAAVGLAACFIPARRAALVDPAVALRCE